MSGGLSGGRANPTSLTASVDSGLVADTLATYKRLADLWLVDSIPRLPSGKVLRRELKAAYEAPLS